jgi:radical SAM protein (TIGR01212 family)
VCSSDLIFCDEGGSGDFAIPYRGQRLYPSDLSYFHGEAREGDFIAYFQAYTNTYAPLPYLEKMFTSALSDLLFAGISIATRPDAMGEEVMDLLSRLKEAFPDKFIWIELGLQTMHEETAALIRRGYLLPVFEECTRQLKDRAIPFFVHIIFGLPGRQKRICFRPSAMSAYPALSASSCSCCISLRIRIFMSSIKRSPSTF